MHFSQPISMPRATHYGNNYWEVYSNKLKRKVCLFSNLEYDNFLSLEMNPSIECFCEQPLEIEVVIDNALVKSIFDVWVKYLDGKEEFQEVKYSSELVGTSKSSLRSQEQIKRQRLWCEQNKIAYCVRTEREINVGEFTIRNYNIISAKVRRFPQAHTDQYELLLIKFLKDVPSISLSNLLHSDILPLVDPIGFLCFMYYKGIITMNLDHRPFDFKTEVSLWQKKS